MKVVRLFQYFSVLNKISAKQRLINGSRYPRAVSESIPHMNSFIATTALSPFQQYLINSKALERPFTGKLWHQMSPGFYHCKICDSRLFTYNHKYQSNTGYATFWRSIEGTVTTVDEEVTVDEVNEVRARHKADNSVYKRCLCSKCNSHLGAVFMDGPPPTFLRYTINSALLNFYDFPDFPNPHIDRRKKRSEHRKKLIKYIR